MASLLALKGRIKAAQNVSKTTKAMQMIAASKLKRAQEATLASRPYVAKLSDLVSGMSQRLDKEKLPLYMQPKEQVNKSLIIIFAPDKGLCGGLITNLLKEFLTLKNHEDASYVVIGKKVEGKVIQLTNEVIANFPFGTTLPSFDAVFPLSRIIDEYYLSGKVDSVKILYTNFNSIFSQKPEVKQLLPITFSQEIEAEKAASDTIFEPTVTEMLPELLQHYVEMTLYQLLLESFVSEQGARMISMQNATKNANDIIDILRLEYNKTRQAKITSEILDIGSGAAASAQ
jgi:F-type H+-transporting ATPase subunit gamma